MEGCESDRLSGVRTSGDRAIMESPFGKNNSALGSLFMAEMAEGKGRFVDQIINGVFASCEMTSWALSAHLDYRRSEDAFRAMKNM